RLYDLAGAVDKLPNLVPTGPDAAAIPLRSTGTDGGAGVVPGVVTGGAEPHQSAPKHTLGIVGRTSEQAPKSLEMQRAGAYQHRPASDRIRVSDGVRTRDILIHSQVL